jgi:hypothetical protein
MLLGWAGLVAGVPPPSLRCKQAGEPSRQCLCGGRGVLAQDMGAVQLRLVLPVHL